MNRNFERALKLVLKHEGGYVNHPNDPGGPTNKGVTLATYRRHINRQGGIADLKRLTTAQAGIVYRAEYWDRVRGSELPDGLDYAMFDFAVHSGPRRAIKYLQGALRVTQDGLLGPVTMDTLLSAPTALVVERLCDSRLAFLKRLKTWKTFGRGWSRRMHEVRHEALAMTHSVMAAKPEIPEPAVEMVSVPVEVPGLDKPVMKSRTAWAAVGGFASTVLGSLAAMPWPATVALIAVAGGLAWWIVHDRKAKAAAQRAIMSLS